MTLRFLTHLCIAIGLGSAAYAQTPLWYIHAPAGTHVGGPGAGVPGKLVTSPVETAQAGGLAALRENLLNLTDGLSKLNGADGANTKQQKIIEEAVGKRVGDTVALLELSSDPLDLAYRRSLLADLRAGPDAERCKHLILYLDALQTHEARERVFAERLNTLIKVHNTPLNWQERIRVSAQVGLLKGQHEIAQQEMIEIENRARVRTAVDRLQWTLDELDRMERSRQIRAVLAAPN